MGNVLQFYVLYYQMELGYPSSQEQRPKVLAEGLVMMLWAADLAECG